MDTGKENLKCDHCNLMGDMKENCFKIIGFPPNFKFTKQKSHMHSKPIPARLVLKIGETKLKPTNNLALNQVRQIKDYGQAIKENGFPSPLKYNGSHMYGAPTGIFYPKSQPNFVPNTIQDIRTEL